MAPVEVLDLFLVEAGKLGIDVSPVPLLVVGDHPEQEHDRQNEDGGRCSEIETVPDFVIGSIEGQEGPG